MKKFHILFLGVITLFYSVHLAGQVIDIRLISDSLTIGSSPKVELLSAKNQKGWPFIKKEAGWKNAGAVALSRDAMPEQWFRCRLTNSDTAPRRIGFYNNGAHVAKLYISNANDTLMVQSGEFTPAKNLQFVHDGNYSSFAIASGDTVWLYGYISYSSFRQSTQQYALYDIGYYHRVLAGKMVSQWGTSQYHSFVLGALAFAAIFIGLIGIWFKNSSYQYYILFLLGGILFVAFKGVQYSYMGMMSQYLGRSRATFSESIQFLFFAAYGMFVLKLMQVERYPRIYKFGKWMVISFLVYAIGMGIYLFSKNILGPSTLFYVGTRIIAFAFSIYLLIAIIKKVHTPGKRFYIAGALSFLIFSLLGFLRQDHPNGWLGAFSPVWYIQTGILIEALLFGLALGYQMYLVESDKRKNYKAYIHQLEVNEKLMKEMNEQLEITVAERTKELEIEKEKQLRLEYEQRITQLEMQALRSQMNPHFIFNSLNSIRYQIQSQQYESASQYLIKFSQLLRQTLENSRKDIVTLEEELKLTKLYLEIEGIRFGESFDYQLKIDDAVDLEEIELPPLLLQPFAENAVKHGLMESEADIKQILIQVAASNGGCTITLEDNGIGRTASDARKNIGGLEHKSLGMEITNERMKVFTKKYGHRLVAEIIDKMENNKPTGTKIIIHYKPKYHV
jgi:sensor histidine kinase YesM